MCPRRTFFIVCCACDVVYCVLCVFQEDILKKLQNSVDSEEKRWAQKLKHAEDELNKVCWVAIAIAYHTPLPLCAYVFLA